MKLVRALVAGAIGALLAAGATSCSGVEQNSGSRHETYQSLDELLGASSAVVSGTVTDQVEIPEATGQTSGTGTSEVTVSTFAVSDSFGPAALGDDPGRSLVHPDDTISVRQMGTFGETLPYPILTPGDQYLLFLAPTGLPGEAADDYYVVGGSAGIYRADGDVFVHAPTEEGDVLPERLTAEQLH